MSGWGRNDNITVTGTLAVTQTSKAVVGSGTAFLTELKAGNSITIASVDYAIDAIIDNTNLNLHFAYAGTTASGLTVVGHQKPTADVLKQPTDIYGVDLVEVASTAGIAAPGWVHRRTVGTRVLHETLVAMKNPPTENNADDTKYPDTLLVFTSSPANTSVLATATATFGPVAVSSTPSATIAWSWEVSTNSGTSWATVSNGVSGTVTYSNATTATLSVATTTTAASGFQYRAIATATVGAAPAGSKTSSAATLTVT